MLLPLLPTESPFALTLQTALRRRGGAARAYDAHARALLAPLHDRQTYLDASVSGKRRKELRRQAKRLEQEGAVTLVQARDPIAVTGALENYLRLEAAGWKGRAGTAAAIHPHICAFLRNAVTGLAASGQGRVTRLMLGEQTIAAGVTLRSGPRAWFWKIAYNETHAAASPGVQLTLAMTQDFLADDTITAADSCATADHPMIDHIWRERLAVADFLVTPAPSRRRFAMACGLESVRRAAIRILRSAKRRLRA
jgi:CelD/BcsL family acetyltransferase involved in cellulose biosynthesis